MKECQLTFALILCGVVDSQFPPAILLPNEASPQDIFGPFWLTEETTLICKADRPDRTTNVWWQGAANFTPRHWTIDSSREGETRITVSPSMLKANWRNYAGEYQCVVNNSFGLAMSAPVRFWPRGTYDKESEGSNLPIFEYRGQSLPSADCEETQTLLVPSKQSLSLLYSWYSLEAGKSIPVEEMSDFAVIVNDLGTIYFITSDGYLYNGLQCEVTFIGKISNATSLMSKIHLRAPVQFGTGIADVRLIYKTRDHAVVAGTRQWISCVFSETTTTMGVGFLRYATPQNVTWKKLGSAVRLPAGKYYNSLLDLGPVTTLHSGSYECTYGKTTESAIIKLHVFDYPIINADALMDAYAEVDQQVDMICMVGQEMKVSINWYFNGVQITEQSAIFKIQWFTEYSSKLRLLKPKLDNTGVVTCEASVRVAPDYITRRNIRLIVYSKPVVDVTFLDGYSLLGTMHTDATVKIMCMFTIDSRATNSRVEWKLSKRAQPINGNTSAADFGIWSAAVSQQSAVQVILTLTYDPSLRSNFVGECSCVVTYRLLDKELTATGHIRLLPEDSTGAEKSWWIISSGACVVLLSLVAAILVYTAFYMPTKKLHTAGGGDEPAASAVRSAASCASAESVTTVLMPTSADPGRPPSGERRQSELHTSVAYPLSRVRPSDARIEWSRGNQLQQRPSAT